IHTGSSTQALGHGSGHLGVNDCHNGDIVGVNTHELAALLHVGDHIVDGNLGCGTGGGGNGDNGQAGLLGFSHAVHRTDIGKLGVGHDDADGLTGIDDAAAADSYDAISAFLLADFHTGLDVLDGGVGLDIVIYGVGNTGIVHDLHDLGSHVEFHQV